MRTSRLYGSSQTTIKKRERLECVNTSQLCRATVIADCVVSCILDTALQNNMRVTQ